MMVIWMEDKRVVELDGLQHMMACSRAGLTDLKATMMAEMKGFGKACSTVDERVDDLVVLLAFSMVSRLVVELVALSAVLLVV